MRQLSCIVEVELLREPVVGEPQRADRRGRSIPSEWNGERNAAQVMFEQLPRAQTVNVGREQSRCH